MKTEHQKRIERQKMPTNVEVNRWKLMRLLANAHYTAQQAEQMDANPYNQYYSDFQGWIEKEFRTIFDIDMVFELEADDTNEFKELYDE